MGKEFEIVREYTVAATPKPNALTVHHFGDVDPKRVGQAWQSWLDGVYA